MSYKWVHHQPLTRIGGDDVKPGEEFQPTEAELRSFADSIEEDESDDADDESEASESDTDEGEARDYAEMDYAELRQLASDADTDDINGRSSKDEILAYFSE